MSCIIAKVEVNWSSVESVRCWFPYRLTDGRIHLLYEVVLSSWKRDEIALLGTDTLYAARNVF